MVGFPTGARGFRGFGSLCQNSRGQCLRTASLGWLVSYSLWGHLSVYPFRFGWWCESLLLLWLKKSLFGLMVSEGGRVHDDREGMASAAWAGSWDSFYCKREAEQADWKWRELWEPQFSLAMKEAWLYRVESFLFSLLVCLSRLLYICWLCICRSLAYYFYSCEIIGLLEFPESCSFLLEKEPELFSVTVSCLSILF